MLSLEEGIKAVKLARETIERYVKGEPKITEKLSAKFDQKLGVFVTINTYPEKELRGCIGYLEPSLELANAIIESAQNACNDPRFEPLTEQEIDKIVVELSILTHPELIEVRHPLEYKEKIKIGVDGLIAEKALFRGILLPQVPVEWKWDEEDFLTHVCMKAGLPPDAWLSKDIKIYKFQAQIFSEVSPRGKIVERKLVEE
ncbi:MAG: TIGR00296 family protein [Candidatus Thermoplasmatota archaeon]|nr:TIGR00296 family protein [Candidatus Thermoplasmatota archaeon]